MIVRLARKHLTSGFTLVEVITVVLIIGVIASFGLIKFAGTIRETREQEAINQLKAIHAANEVYRERSITSPPGYLTGANLDLDAINTNLGLSIFANKITYQYTGGGNAYIVTATYPGAGSFTISMDQGDLDGGNPWCSAGPCPTL